MTTNKYIQKREQHLARKIVANLVQRYRNARKAYLRGVKGNYPDERLFALDCQCAEAHNALEACRRILNGLDP